MAEDEPDDPPPAIDWTKVIWVAPPFKLHTLMDAARFLPPAPRRPEPPIDSPTAPPSP